MSETKLLFLYFLMGLIFGGASGALYIVGSVKYGRIRAEFLRDTFQQLLILWIVIGFVVILATSVLK